MLLHEDAEFFGCVPEVEAARDIIAHGTSAHRQVARYGEALAAGAGEEDALKAVVDQLIEETVEGL